MMRPSKMTYLISILIPLAVGGVSAVLGMDGIAEYRQLAKPPLAPPGFVFSIVWTVLYLLMGISSALVYDSRKPERGRALLIYGLQLAVNFFWVIFFFAFRWRLFAFLWIILLIVLVLSMIRRFREILPLAGNLQIPYLIWLVFAAYLNLGVYLLNR